MADFKIEVPINVSGDKSGKKIGEKIAEQVERSLKAVGIGKKEGGGPGGVGGFGKSGLKIAGTLGAILGVLDALNFLLKPILSLFKIIIMLLFLPLIPILKPAMQGLAAFIKWFAPVMKKISSLTEKMHKALTDFLSGIVIGIMNIFKGIFEGLGDAWEVIKSSGIWIWDTIIKPAFGFLKDVGVWIWEQILLPSFLVLGDLGLQIWEVIKSLFQGIIKVPEMVWGFIKTLFEGIISVGATLWDWFKTLFKGTISVAGTVWGWFKGLFKGSGNSTRVNDAIITPQGIVHTNPQDFIIATKDPSKLFSGGNSIIININNPSVRQDSDIKRMVNEISRALQRQMPGRISQ